MRARFAGLILVISACHGIVACKARQSQSSKAAADDAPATEIAPMDVGTANQLEARLSADISAAESEFGQDVLEMESLHLSDSQAGNFEILVGLARARDFEGMRSKTRADLLTSALLFSKFHAQERYRLAQYLLSSDGQRRYGRMDDKIHGEDKKEAALALDRLLVANALINAHRGPDLLHAINNTAGKAWAAAYARAQSRYASDLKRWHVKALENVPSNDPRIMQDVAIMVTADVMVSLGLAD